MYRKLHRRNLRSEKNSKNGKSHFYSGKVFLWCHLIIFANEFNLVSGFDSILPKIVLGRLGKYGSQKAKERKTGKPRWRHSCFPRFSRNLVALRWPSVSKCRNYSSCQFRLLINFVIWYQRVRFYRKEYVYLSSSHILLK